MGVGGPGLDRQARREWRGLPGRSQDGDYAWSAAFIDYVMRMAGAGDRFPYSPSHADYINEARRHGGGAWRSMPSRLKPMRRSAAT